jgi:hypothetical protein
MSRIGRPPPEPPSGPKKQLPQSDVASQVPSKGRALKGMSFWEGLVHYVFFGWLVAYFTSKTDRRDEAEVTNEIMRLFPEKGRAEIGGVLYNKFDLSELKQLENILQDPAARAHLLYAGPLKYEEVLNQFLQDPQKTKSLFQDLAQAQKLLNGRIDSESAFKINTFLLEHPSSLQQDFNAFLKEASRLQNKKPHPLAPSKETDHLTNKLHPQLADQVAKNPLVANLLQEIVFVTTQPILQALSGSSRAKSYFHDNYKGVTPFALQYMYESTESSIIISVSDPKTKEVRRAEIPIPKGITKEKLVKWLENPQAVQLSENELRVAEKFLHDSHQAFATAIFALRTLPQKGQKGEIYTVVDRFGDRKLSLDVTVTTNKIENELEVVFTRNEKSYTVRYPFKEGESQQELAGRIYSDHTLERDFMLASLILF